MASSTGEFPAKDPFFEEWGAYVACDVIGVSASDVFPFRNFVS